MLIIYFIVTVVCSGLAFAIRKSTINHLVVSAFCLFLAYFSYYEFTKINTTQWYFFKPDALGLIFLFILSIVGFVTTIHYRIYASKRDEKARTVSIHNAFFILFLGALTGVYLSDHFGMLWAFIEATTLAAAVLIFHDRDHLALEAVWKYIFVCSVSITLAFAGILFLSIGAQEAHSISFYFADVQQLAPAMNPVWIKACFLFVIVGFSVKMGVFPMFNVDIDAKDISPSPIGAMFSTVLLNSGFLSVFRFYTAFSGTSIQPWMHHVLIITGTLSIFFAAAYLIKVKNFKRILAYSGMEHAGLILLAVAMGRPGYVAALMHIVFHSFIKSSLFFQIGQVHRYFGSKGDSQTGGYLFKNPYGGMILIIGLFSVLAFPPSGLFFSELLIFKSFIGSGQIALCITVMILLLMIMYTFSQNFLHLLFTTPNEPNGNNPKRIPPWESVSQLVLLATSMYLGVFQPDFFMDFLNSALLVIK